MKIAVNPSSKTNSEVAIMKCASNGKKSWAKRMIQKWEELVFLYQKAKTSPSVRRWGKVLFGILKIIVPILIRKVIGLFFKDF